MAALTLVACFADVAEACAKPLMAACAQYVLPQLEAFFTNFLQNHTPNIHQTTTDPTPAVVNPAKVNLMILAGELTIHDPNNKDSWEKIKITGDTRFKDTEVLTHGSRSWEIKASINFDLLLPMKTYGVYLIFKTTPDAAGLDAVLTATLSTEIGDEPKDVCLSLKPKANADQNSGDIKLPVKSSYEEWMELELGEFLCSNIAAKRMAEISIKVKESGKHHMRGVYVAGIELRSKSY